MNILNIEHVSKIFGEKKIFDDVSYGIHEGDKIGIIGINGTGKTTLLKIIAGIESPDGGSVIMDTNGKLMCLIDIEDTDAYFVQDKKSSLVKMIYKL